jgi:hypothetical protein
MSTSIASSYIPSSVSSASSYVPTKASISSVKLPTVLDEEESPIDAKRDAKKRGKKANFKNFLISFLYYVVVNILIFIVLIGLPMLYIIKLAKSDILPDDPNFFPFTSIPNETVPYVVNMNTLKQRSFNGFGFTESIYSQKATFDANDYYNSLSKGFIGFLNKLGDPKNDSTLGLYFSKTFKQMIATSFWGMNTLFYYFNYLPDWVNMILFGGISFGFGGILNIFGNGVSLLTILFTILLPIILFSGLSFLLTTYTFLMGVIYHILNLKDLFKSSTTQGFISKEDVWESDKDVTFFRMFTSPIRFLKMIFVIFYCIPVTSTVGPIIVTLHNVLTALFQTSYKTKGSSETFSFKDFLIDNVIYKKTFLLILLSYGLVLNSFSHLGTHYGIGSLIAVVVLSFVFGVFKPSVPTSATQTPGLAK